MRLIPRISFPGTGKGQLERRQQRRERRTPLPLETAYTNLVAANNAIQEHNGNRNAENWTATKEGLLQKQSMALADYRASYKHTNGKAVSNDYLVQIGLISQ